MSFATSKSFLNATFVVSVAPKPFSAGELGVKGARRSGAVRGGKLDLNALPTWAEDEAVDKPFLNSFTFYEGVMNNATTPAGAVQFELRRLLATMAGAVKDHKHMQFRMVVEDAANSVGLTIDMPLALLRDDDGMPVLVVRYARHSVDSPNLIDDLNEMLAQAKVGGDFSLFCQQKDLKREVVDALFALLECNSALIKEGTGPQNVPACMRLSMIRPVQLPKAEYPCAVCGEEARSRCSRCSGVRYCSREHQAQDWKRHKKVCRDAAKAAAADVPGSYVDVMVTQGNDLFSGMFTSTLSFHAPQSNNFTESKGRRGDPLGVPDTDSVLIKIQLPMLPTMRAHSGRGMMMVYDKRRTFQLQISESNATTAGYDAIADLIRSKGVQGLKGYFNASIRENGTVLRVFMAGLMPPQPW